jgi:small GTP-binding protein
MVTMTATLLLSDSVFTIAIEDLLANCTLFATNPGLLSTAYSVKSRVSREVFEQFQRGLKGELIAVTDSAMGGLASLCREFGFSHLLLDLRSYEGRESESGVSYPSSLVFELRERLHQQEQRLAALSQRLSSKSSKPSKTSEESEIDRIERDLLEIGRAGSGLGATAAVSVALREPGPPSDSAPPGPPPPPPPPAPPFPSPAIDCSSRIVPSIPLDFSDFKTHPGQRFKCVIVGPSCSGKTSLAHRMVSGTFVQTRPHPSPNQLGLHIAAHKFPTILWDVPGNEAYRESLALFAREADGAIVVFDLTDRSALPEIVPWIDPVRKQSPGAAILLVGSKADRSDRRVLDQDISNFIETHQFEYYETSAATGEGVDELVAALGRALWRGRSKEYGLDGEWRLLWRGSRDGFSAGRFHERCDGQDHTITLIRDTKGNVFGGSTPIAWQSSFFGKSLSDDLNQSFIFTLTNPHGLPPTIFKLRWDSKSSAIYVSSWNCPCFGNGDLFISNKCNVKPSRTDGFGSTYKNETGIDGSILLTGSPTFLVQEIEVFSIKRN